MTPFVPLTTWITLFLKIILLGCLKVPLKSQLLYHPFVNNNHQISDQKKKKNIKKSPFVVNVVCTTCVAPYYQNQG